MDASALRKGLEVLDTAFAAGIPRGDNEIAAEIMAFAINTDEVDTGAALAFAYKLSGVIAKAQSSSLTVQLLEAQNAHAAQMSEIQGKLKVATSFIKSHGLLDEFNSATDGKARKGKKGSEEQKETSSPAVSADAATVTDQTPAADLNPAAPGEEEKSEIQEEHTQQTELETEPAAPASATTPEPAVAPVEKKDLGDKPTAYDFLTQEGYTVAKVDGISVVKQTAETRAKETGSKVFPVHGGVFRVVAGGEVLPVSGSTDGKSYVVAAELPAVEFFVSDNRYIKNPDFVPSTES